MAYRSQSIVHYTVMAFHNHLSYRAVIYCRGRRLDWIAEEVGGQQAGEDFENQTYFLRTASVIKVSLNVRTY